MDCFFCFVFLKATQTKNSATHPSVPFHFYPCLSPLVVCIILSNGIVHVNDKSSEKAHLVSVMSKIVCKCRRLQPRSPV